MRSLHLLLIVLLLATMALLPACSRDDDESGPADLTDPGPGEALADYWDAGGNAGEALTEVNDLWAAFAALAADPAVPADSTLQAAVDFATACEDAASMLHAWHDLEQNIVPQGEKAQFTDLARETALDVLATAATAAETGAEGLVVSWKVLGGLQGLREAFVDPDGTIPVAGILAGQLESRLTYRDEQVVAAILDGQDRGGLLPLDELEGASAAERAEWYTSLDGDHPLKRQCRAAVPSWDSAEQTISMTVLERAARGHLRLFADVGAGGSPLADLAGHLTGADESAPTIHNLTFALRNGDGSEPITGAALLVIRRRDQSSQAPRLAVLTGASAQILADLPAGTYDILALAEGWARDIVCDAATSNGLQIPLRLRHLQQETLILETVEAPDMAGAGMRVNLRAIAASTSGDGLSFSWDIRGGEIENVQPAGDACVFTPATAGTYIAAVTVRDEHGNACTDSTTIEVTSFALEVFRTEFLIEQIPDFHFNPGESDTLWIWVANRGDDTVVGTPRLTGRDGLDLDISESAWTLGAGRQTRWQVPVSLPVDWDQPRAKMDFSFTVGDETLVQELDFRVDFYVTMNYIRSPVTSRILAVSGIVANPSLEVAQLVVDRDRNLVYDLPLDNGTFEQVVILAGSEVTRRIRVEVAAESGNRRETAGAGFMAAITRADFRATLFWDTNGTDVDLWVTDPDGEKCYFANKTTASGLELDIDDVTGYGPENITGESNLPPGEYLVQLHYYSDHGTGLASHCTVMITLHEGTDDEMVEIYEQTIADGDVWTVATVTWDGAKAVRVTPAQGRVITAAPPQMAEK